MVAVHQPEVLPSTSSDDPNRSNLIHDPYGPGPFLAWLMGANALLSQLYSNLRERPQYRMLDKDLFLTLSYPMFTGGHMFRQVFQYAGPEEEIWWTKGDAPKRYITAEHLPAAMAIQAAGRVCVAGLAIKIAIAFRLRGSKWRSIINIVASVWTLFCLIYASCDSGWLVVLIGNIKSILLTGLCVLSPLWSFPSLIIGVGGFVKSVRWSHFVSTNPKTKERSFINLVSSVMLVIGPVGSFVAFGLLADLFVPETAHSFFELFQVFAFVVGFVSVVLSLRDLWKPGELGYAVWELAGDEKLDGLNRRA
jgi:hypothetical protein